jgi:hypothetical protein
MFFLLFLLAERRIRYGFGCGSGRPQNMDPTDPIGMRIRNTAVRVIYRNYLSGSGFGSESLYNKQEN